MFSSDVQECVLIFLVPVIENTAIKYVLSYTYVRYIRIILCQKLSYDAPMYLFLERLKYLILLRVFVRIRTNSICNLSILISVMSQ